MNKGKNVCERRVIGKDLLEKWVVDQIKAILVRYFDTPEGLLEIRKLVEVELAEGGLQIGEELDRVEARLREVRQTIANLIDNLTSTNRDFVDARLVELKRESAVLESKRLGLEAAGARRAEIDRLIDQAVQLAGEFETVFAGGTIQEKRLLVRAFVKEIMIEPGDGDVKVVLMPFEIGKGQDVCVGGEEVIRRIKM